MVGCAGYRETRDRGPLASGRLPPVLEMEIAPIRRPTKSERGDQKPDSSAGNGKSDLGRSEDPWRTSEDRIRDRGTHRGQISATCEAPRRSCQTLARFPCQSSRSDRRHGFLYRAHTEFSTPVLFLRDRAWTAQDPAFQRHSSPDLRLGGATIT